MLVSFNDRIKYIKASENPLSSDVIFIEGDENIWVFDVGCTDESYEVICNTRRHICAILSHFHKDHIGNIGRLIEAKNGDITLFVSKQTYKYTDFGEIVDGGPIEIDDGVKIKIFPIPSSHSKGCLGLEINDEFAFLGDAIYPTYENGDKVYNAQLLKEQLEVLKSLKAQRFYLSHEDRQFINGNVIILFLRNIYERRNPKESKIVVKDKRQGDRETEKYKEYERVAKKM